MNKLKMLILAIMIMFIVNVSVFCVLIYGMYHMDATTLKVGAAPTEAGNKSITIEHGEILIINDCKKSK